MAALLLATSALQVAARPASAIDFGSTVLNLIATNEIGEPLDESGITSVFDNENLWAYVTTVGGGVVCVHEVGVAIGDGADCDGGGWGKGFAPPFFAGLIPVAPAPLRAGTWVLMATSSDENDVSHVDAVSQTFIIESCSGPCPNAAPPDPSAAKAVFGGIASSINIMCQSAKALNLTQKLAKIKDAYDMMVVDPSGAGFGMFIVKTAVDVGAGLVIGGVKPKAVAYLPSSIGWAIWGLCKSFFGVNFPNSPIPFVSGPHVNEPGPLAVAYHWLNDPPQSYQSVAVADFIDYSQFDTSEFDAAALSIAEPIDRMRGYLSAGTTAYERFQGALADDATPFAHDQAVAIQVNFDGLKAALADASNSIDPIVAAIQADASISNSLDQADIDAAGIVMRRVRDTGFTTSETAALQALGVSGAGIIELRDEIGGDTDALVGPMTFSGSLATLAQNMRAARDAVDGFATQAAFYAQNTQGTNAAPVALFTATPPTGPAPLDVVFDASGSSDPDGDSLTYAWDFGDSATETGVSVHHSYASGSYTARLTVSDGTNTDSVTTTITATGNHAPVVANEIVSIPINTPVTFNALQNDFDPDGDLLTLSGPTSPAHGTRSCASDGQCTYTPGLNYTGNDAFDYTVSDGNGGATTGSVAITVRPADDGNNPPVAVDDDVSVVAGHTNLAYTTLNDFRSGRRSPDVDAPDHARPRDRGLQLLLVQLHRRPGLQRPRHVRLHARRRPRRDRRRDGQRYRHRRTRPGRPRRCPHDPRERADPANRQPLHQRHRRGLRRPDGHGVHRSRARLGGLLPDRSLLVFAGRCLPRDGLVRLHRQRRLRQVGVSVRRDHGHPEPSARSRRRRDPDAQDAAGRRVRARERPRPRRRSVDHHRGDLGSARRCRLLARQCLHVHARPVVRGARRVRLHRQRRHRQRRRPRRCRDVGLPVRGLGRGGRRTGSRSTAGPST